MMVQFYLKLPYYYMLTIRVWLWVLMARMKTDCKLKEKTSLWNSPQGLSEENAMINSPYVRQSRVRKGRNICLWNPESGIFFLVESRIMSFGIWNTAQGIPNPTDSASKKLLDFGFRITLHGAIKRKLTDQYRPQSSPSCLYSLIRPI